MELTPKEKEEVLSVDPSTQQTFCIFYWKISDGPSSDKKILRRINSNGVPISTKKYSEVFFYNDVRHALIHSRYLISRDYDVTIRKCNKLSNDKIWLM